MPSSGLNSIYSPLIPDSSVLKDPLAGADKSSSTLNNSTQPEEKMLLSQENGRQLVKILEIPELEVELERAIWQVEGAIRRAKEAKVEKEESAKPSDTTKNE